MVTTMHNAPRGWTLDEAINHELYVKETARSMAAMPSVEAVKEAEQFYMSELFFTPVKSRRAKNRAWKISLPLESGRKVRRGMTLLLMEKIVDADTRRPHEPDFGRVSLLVYVAKWRRLVQPRYINWRGTVPFFGTLRIHLFNKEAGLAWFPSGLSDLDKYTKSVEI